MAQHRAEAGGRTAAAARLPAQPAAPAQPSAPVRTETIVYDNWVVTCRDTVGKSSKRNCSAVMQISNKKTKQSVFVWQIGQDNDGKPVFAVRTPLGVRVQEGVQLTVGTGKPRKVDFVLCEQRGCDARGPFDDAFAKELVAGSEATAAFVLADGKTVNLEAAAHRHRQGAPRAPALTGRAGQAAATAPSWPGLVPAIHGCTVVTDADPGQAWG